MTKDQYLRMIEQTGEEIDWDRCPPDIEDFPEIVVTSINIFHSLGDRIYSDVGFTGKDYTTLPLLYKFYHIEEYQKESVFEILLVLENNAREDSQRRIKEQYDKFKRK